MPRPLYPQVRPGTHCTGGWVGPRAGLDVCEKSRPPPGFDPRTVQPVVSRYTDWAIRPHIVWKSEHELCQVTQCSKTRHSVMWDRGTNVLNESAVSTCRVTEDGSNKSVLCILTALRVCAATGNIYVSDHKTLILHNWEDWSKYVTVFHGRVKQVTGFQGHLPTESPSHIVKPT
jgi:hypothetical protein